MFITALVLACLKKLRKLTGKQKSTQLTKFETSGLANHKSYVRQCCMAGYTTVATPPSPMPIPTDVDDVKYRQRCIDVVLCCANKLMSRDYSAAPLTTRVMARDKPSFTITETAANWHWKLLPERITGLPIECAIWTMEPWCGAYS